MNTIKLFSAAPIMISQVCAWYLSDIGEARGKQDLFTKQSPQKLKILREYALIESAVSSNRMEGVTVAVSRIGRVLFSKSHLQDRNEEEVNGAALLLLIANTQLIG